MNQRVDINLAGLAFSLDEQGYQALEQYLATLRRCYGEGAEGDEILSDIEARIAELLLNEQYGEMIPLSRIQSVLDQLGLPDEVVPTPPPVPEESIPRRLYRDPEHRKIAGVCSGLGAFFNIDPALVRLAIFLPLILSITSAPLPFDFGFRGLMGTLFGAAVLTYFILWAAIPLARSPRHKLEMRGRSITPDAIREQVREQAVRQGNSPEQRRNARLRGDTAYALGSIALVFVKVIAIGVLFVLACAIFGLVAAAIALIVGDGSRVMIMSHRLAALPALSGIGWEGLILVLLAGIALPLVAFGLLLLRTVFNVGKGGGRTQAILWGLWAIVLVFVAVIAIKNASTLREVVHRQDVEWDSSEQWGSSERWDSRDDG